MEGRYRFVQDKLMIENIISSIEVPEVLMNVSILLKFITEKCHWTLNIVQSLWGMQKNLRHI